MQKAHREKMKYIQAMADFVSDNLRNAYYMHKDVAKAIDSVFKGIDDIMLHMTLTKLDPDYADEAKVKLEDKVESLKEAAKSVRKAINEEEGISNFKSSKRNELVRNFSKVSKKYKVLVTGFERYEKISKDKAEDKAKALDAFNTSSKAIADALRTVVSALQSSPDIAIENQKIKVIGASIFALQFAAGVSASVARSYITNKMIS